MACSIQRQKSYSHNSNIFDTSILFDDNNNIHGSILIKRRTGLNFFNSKSKKIWKLKKFFSFEFDLNLEHSDKSSYFPVHFDHSFTTSTIVLEPNNTINNLIYKFSLFPINKPKKYIEFGSPIKEDIITFYGFINDKIEIDQHSNL